jgi:uncharacterized UPF0160 family protein
MSPQVVPRSIGVHSGTFHADEVSACALFVLFDLVDADKIVRSREPEELAKCEYVCDVGGKYKPAAKLFDHHQADYSGPLSSAGMVLKYLLETGRLSDKEYQFFNASLIIGVDDHDNGRAPIRRGYCSFSHIVSNYVPCDHEADKEEVDAAFMEAFRFVYGHLQRIWKKYQYVCSCREAVAEAMKNGRDCLIFESSLPWVEGFFEEGGNRHPARFIIMPSGEHWKLRAIPPSLEDRMSVRAPLPEKWAGLLDEKLEEASGIPGAIFCHKGRFISVWKTKDAALKALERTLEIVKEA